MMKTKASFARLRWQECQRGRQECQRGRQECLRHGEPQKHLTKIREKKTPVCLPFVYRKYFNLPFD
jgi:hypothetical protein